MKASDFLKAVTPSEGVLFAAVPVRFEKDGRTIDYFKHTVCYTHDDLALQCKAISQQGDNAFFALASFKQESYIDKRTSKKKQRTQENAMLARSMWLDIDCGENKPYATQLDGIAALRAGFKAAKLPAPTFTVSSGYGVHAYWTFTKDIPKALWIPVAQLFKAVMDGTGLVADKVTANIACVLRPIGTNNYKRGGTQEVRVLHKAKSVRFSDWARALKKASGDLKVTPPKQRLTTTLNSALSGGMDEYPPSDAEKIADKCAVLNEMRNFKGSTHDEQQWYSCIGVLRHTTQGEDIVQGWSAGHHDYDPIITTDKIKQWEDRGPTLCDTMRQLFPACADCKMKCNSPISLGYPDPEHQTTVEVIQDATDEVVLETLPQLPDGLKDEFAWVEGRGLMARLEDEDGNVRHVVVCSQFPVPEFIFYDKLSEAFYVRVSARTAPYTWQSGDLPLDVVQRGGVNLIGALGGKCAVTVRDDGRLLVKFMKTWVDVIRQSTDLQTMRDQMGWQKDGSFLLGKTLYRPDGEIKDVVVARSLAKYAESHTPKGDRQAFVDTIDKLYNKPNYQEYQFLWLASFGSLLIKFLHSHNIGITLAAYSPDSGTGKTSVAKAAIANFGDPSGFGQQADGQDGATEYAITVMAGLRHNLPILIDEVTNWEPNRLGKFLYRVCNGTAKVQGSADGGLRDSSAYNWNSVSYITSNSPLASKVSSETKNSQAQLARLFDIKFYNKGFDTQDSVLFEKLWQHSGNTGAEFVEYVTVNQDKVSKICHKMLDRLNKKAEANQSARFWMMLAAATLTAAHITRQLDMHQFNIDELEDWTIQRIKEIRVVADRSVESVEDMARSMMSDFQNGMVVTTDEAKRVTDFTPFAPGYGAPRQSVRGRYIVSTGDIMIPVGIIRKWCAENSVDYSDFRRRLTDKNWMVDADLRYDVGKGTSVASTRSRCWKLNFESAAHVLSVIEPGENDGSQEDQQQEP
ncbi:MAG: DUF927 domain-containing protein [Chloroflexi bacterium]|nr:DUF927 domain-containing protein [Chloroflexota bacterium]MBT7538644.1 DUF927 domain-containing protein [Gammaproteobacteria bacterium]